MLNLRKILNEYNVQRAIQAAIDYFGYTTNFKKAGYILPNGKMLDLSGKRQGGTPNIRSLDHREINVALGQAGIEDIDLQGSWGDKYSNAVHMVNFVNNAGAIRISPFYIESMIAIEIGITEPTQQQYKTLRAICAQVDNVRVALSDKKGDQLNYKEFGTDTDYRKPSWNKIKSFIFESFN